MAFKLKFCLLFIILSACTDIAHGQKIKDLSLTKQYTEHKLLEPIVLVHGGAGEISTTLIPEKLEGVKLAAQLGYRKLISDDGTALDAVEEAVRSMERDKVFNAGYGAVLTINGEVEADAAIMNGKDLNAGCVSIVKDILHPISLAGRVMTETPHNYLAGEGVMQFARQQGFRILPAGALVTAAAQKALDDYKNSLNETKSGAIRSRTMKLAGIEEITTINETGRPSSLMVQDDFRGSYAAEANGRNQWKQFGEPGTVGAIAIDKFGNFAAGTSTGGITGKLAGRIGDSPILGAGTYADNLLGAVSATGHGESFMKFGVALRILHAMRFGGLSAQQASEEILSEMTDRLNATGGVITLSRDGEIGIYFNSKRMAWAYQRGNELKYGIDKEDHHIQP